MNAVKVQNNMWIRKIYASLVLISLSVMVLFCGQIINEKYGSIQVFHNLRKDGWAEVGKGIYVSRGLVSENMTLVISGKEAAVIDTGTLPLLGDQPKGILLLKDIIDQNDLTVKYIFFTHYHLDHYQGMKYFKNLDKPNAEKPICLGTDNSYEGQTITMGDRVFKIINTPGHGNESGGHMSIELTNEKILVAGDIICTSFVPYLLEEDSYKDYIQSVKKIKANNYKLIIPGHGNIIDTKITVERPLNYLIQTTKLVRKVIEDNGTLRDAYNKVKLEDYIGKI
jgi:glyoxylase-like metal-dependent hydrolase (beta-lactamase superfamily II)